MKQGPGPPFAIIPIGTWFTISRFFLIISAAWSSISLFFRLIRRNEEMDKQVQIRADSQKRLY